MRIRHRCRRFLFQPVSHIASGEMLQVLGLIVNTVHRHTRFGNEVLFPQPMGSNQFCTEATTGFGQLIT